MSILTLKVPNARAKSVFFLSEGGRVGFIERRARLAWVHHAPRGMVPRELQGMPRGSLILPRQPPTKSSVFVCVPFSDPIFEDSFGGLLVLKMAHVSYRRKFLDVYFLTI